MDDSFGRKPDVYNRRQWTMNSEEDLYPTLPRSPREAALSPDDQRLLRQQEWLWNCDTSWQGRNLLSEYGFEAGAGEGGLHSFALPGNAMIWVCDGSVLYATEERGAVVLRSPQPAPALLSQELSTLPPRAETIRRARVAQLPTDRDSLAALVPPLMAWIGAYERWVLDTFGIGYRKRCLDGIDYAACDAEEIPARWWDAASRWRETLREY